eukprot:s2138_g9.t1
MELLVTIAQDIEPYVIQWPSQVEVDGVLEISVLVAMKRPDGVLLVFPSDALPADEVFESPLQDRQIGDRRYPNACEYHVPGPSKDLPPGHLLAQIHVKRGREKLLGSVTDRRDFYHQALVSSSRASTNMLPFSYPIEVFNGTAAYEKYFEEKFKGRKRKDRFEAGDLFGQREEKQHVSGQVFPSFTSLFQGDHLGVEFALSSHEHLLKEEGILNEAQRLLLQRGLPTSDMGFWALQRKMSKPPTISKRQELRLIRGLLRYERHGLLGSPEKDVEASDHFKAAGAEIDSRPVALRNGLCIVASPFAKRFALSALSLRAAALPSISPLLAARLSGNWVSALLYRRCISSVVDDFFALSAGLEKPGAEKVVPLKRKCAEELVLLAVLCPMMFANVAADFSQELYVSDASIQKGAVVSGAVPRESLRALWQSTEKRGHYTVLEDPLRARLKHLVEEIELPEELPAWEGDVIAKPFKPPLLVFDFVEVCGGAGVVSKQAAKLGLVVAPVLDLRILIQGSAWVLILRCPWTCGDIAADEAATRATSFEVAANGFNWSPKLRHGAHEKSPGAPKQMAVSFPEHAVDIAE